MFNLEQSIAEWRRQMTAGGIEITSALDELESHLREEIERQMKSGLNEHKAFQMAVQQIGVADALKTEFQKNSVSSTKAQMEHWFAEAVCLISVYAGFQVIFWSIMASKAPPVEEYRDVAMAAGVLGFLMVIGASYGAFICIRKIKTIRGSLAN